MLSLPSITPRDSHELWFGSSQPYRSTSQQQGPGDTASPHHSRRNGSAGASIHRTFLPSRAPANTLSALLMEERALRARKQNIASFGCSWIRPAGCAKTMLGMKEEEAEREEALAAAAAEMAAAEGMMDADEDEQIGMPRDGEIGDEDNPAMEHNLDDDIPDADAETGDGLIEEGEEGLEEDNVPDEEEYMERDLDDDVPEGYPDDEYGEEGFYGGDDDEEAFDNQPDLDAEIPVAGEGEGMSEDMGRDPDDDIPEAAENGSEQEGEWQHTDTEEELEEDDEEVDEPSIVQNRFAASFRTSTPNSRGGLPPPPVRRERETEAQHRFLQRWSGGGDAFDSSSMLYDDDDLRASITSQGSRRSGFGRRFPGRTGGPRDSLN